MTVCMMLMGYCLNKQDTPRKNGYPSNISAERLATNPPICHNIVDDYLITIKVLDKFISEYLLYQTQISQTPDLNYLYYLSISTLTR